MFTLHKKTSFIAFYLMLIHAIVQGSVGLHWFLHEKSILLSIVLLILNVYTVIFIIGEIQAVRLNPLDVSVKGIYVSLGLTKRIYIPYSEISELKWGSYLTVSEHALEFITKDMEPLPHVGLILSIPIESTLFVGMKKE